ncbi:isocitrate lyase/phosphoenolpyruvate mutase family protein [Streptomyces scopuliridis]|uniref:isocitrate lyase/phosphoenolpyruvate mutase family protein n=1 Tax=Streptomyces scopuliridis TaxID=452529 RepID=UPI0036B74043
MGRSTAPRPPPSASRSPARRPTTPASTCSSTLAPTCSSSAWARRTAGWRTSSPAGNAYREAGACGLFVPGLLDLDALGTVARETGLKVNAMWLPGAPAPEQLREAGVSRYSAGTAIAPVAYTAAADAARAFLAGQDKAMAASLNYAAFNDKFAK